MRNVTAPISRRKRRSAKLRAFSASLGHIALGRINCKLLSCKPQLLESAPEVVKLYAFHFWPEIQRDQKFVFRRLQSCYLDLLWPADSENDFNFALQCLIQKLSALFGFLIFIAEKIKLCFSKSQHPQSKTKVNWKLKSRLNLWTCTVMLLGPLPPSGMTPTT